MAGLVEDELGQHSLALAVEVLGTPVTRRPTPLQQLLARLGQRHAGEWRLRDHQLGAEHLFDLFPQHVAHTADGIGEHLLLHAHDVVHDSIQAISRSRPVNSVECREVKLGSARKTGPTSMTRSNPAAMANCM